MDNFGNLLQADNIAVVVGAIVALSLALKAAVGPVVMYVTEAIKVAFNIPAGKGGLVAIVIGMLIGAMLGILAGLTTQAGGSDYIPYVGVGLVAGLFMAAGAVETHKASGSINMEASAAIQNDKEYKADKAADEALPMSYNLMASPAPLPPTAESIIRARRELDALRAERASGPRMAVDDSEPRGGMGAAASPQSAAMGLDETLANDPKPRDGCSVTPN